MNALLLHAKLNFNLWGEALLIVCYILNRIPMKKNEISPYELLITKKKNCYFIPLLMQVLSTFCVLISLINPIGMLRT